MKLARRSLIIVVFMLVLGAPISPEAAAGGDIALAQVPENILAAAEKAVPGIKFTEAEVDRSPKGHIYELEGTAGGKEYEIEVSAEGKVLKVEEEDHEHRSR